MSCLHGYPVVAGASGGRARTENASIISELLALKKQRRHMYPQSKVGSCVFSCVGRGVWSAFFP